MSPETFAVGTVRGSAPETVTRILAAAEKLFAARGYDAVSMNEIAEAAAVSKANIFHHFSSKQALYLAVVRNACHDAAERLQELEQAGGPLPERLVHYAQGQLDEMLAHDHVTRLILRELLKEGSTHGRALAEQVFGQHFARLVQILRAGQTRGELRANVDPAMIATLLIGANVFFVESRELLQHLPGVGFAGDPAGYSRALVDILLRGILSGQQEKNDAVAETPIAKNI